MKLRFLAVFLAGASAGYALCLYFGTQSQYHGTNLSADFYVAVDPSEDPLDRVQSAKKLSPAERSCVTAILLAHLDVYDSGEIRMAMLVLVVTADRSALPRLRELLKRFLGKDDHTYTAISCAIEQIEERYPLVINPRKIR